MAEQKKFDKTSIIGMLLMGGILIWIMYFNKPTEEEVKAKEAQQEQVVSTPATNPSLTEDPAINVPVSDSLGQIQLQNRVGAFAYGGTTEGTTTVKNDVLELKVANKGGHIIEAKLLQHKTFDSIPVYLIKDGNSAFNVSFSTADNRNLNTKDLFFKPSLTQNGENQVLSMRLNVSPTQFLEYRYELKPGDYMLDFGLKSQGL